MIPPYLMVILDQEGTIVEFESTLDGCLDNPNIKGKNWFDTFIDPKDKDKIWHVFQTLISGDEQTFQSYRNDILCPDGTHRLIDFYNKVLHKDGKPYTFSVGVEHMHFDKEQLDYLGKTLFETTFLNDNTG